MDVKSDDDGILAAIYMVNKSQTDQRLTMDVKSGDKGILAAINMINETGQHRAMNVKSENRAMLATVKTDHLSGKGSLLATLYQYQQAGHLCDLTVRSSDGRHFEAHAGVLAAASSVIAQELSECDRGNYTIDMALNSAETDALIKFAYTGTKIPLECCGITLNDLWDQTTEGYHNSHIVCKLDEFAEKGLFCNMALHSADGEIQPAHSFVMAAKYEFMSQHIQTGSIVYFGFPETKLENSNVPLTTNERRNNFEANLLTITRDYVCYAWPDIFKDNHDSISLLSHGNMKKIKNELKRKHRRFECDTCHKKLKSRTDLVEHTHIHTGENSYVCDKCGKQFRTKINITQHQLTHIEGKSHVCKICDKRFQCHRYLLSHRRKMHIKPDDRPYECTICHRRFVSDRGLTLHKLTLHKPIHSDDNT